MPHMSSPSLGYAVPSLEHDARRRRAVGIALLVAASVMWSLSGLAVKVVRVDSIAFAFWRSAGAALAMLPVAPFATGRLPRPRSRSPPSRARPRGSDAVSGSSPSRVFAGRGEEPAVAVVDPLQELDAPAGRDLAYDERHVAKEIPGDEATFAEVTGGPVGRQPVQKGRGPAGRHRIHALGEERAQDPGQDVTAPARRQAR